MVSQIHLPVATSHFPRLEHSTKLCASSSDVATPLHAGPVGQERREQSDPVYPVKQEHTPQGVVHLPLPEQELGHGEKCVNADEDGVGYWAMRMR